MNDSLEAVGNAASLGNIDLNDVMRVMPMRLRGPAKGYWRTFLASRPTGANPEAQGTMVSLLEGSVMFLEYTAELRLLMDEELERARELMRGKVPLKLLTPQEFLQIMEEARSRLPPDYSFSASPTDMALSLASAKITVLTKGKEAPYYGVLEFPIHRAEYELYQVQAVRVSGGGGGERQ